MNALESRLIVDLLPWSPPSMLRIERMEILIVCFFSIFSLYATYTVNKDVYI